MDFDKLLNLYFNWKALERLLISDKDLTFTMNYSKGWHLSYHMRDEPITISIGADGFIEYLLNAYEKLKT